MRKQHHKLETSKLLLIVSDGMAAVVLVCTIVAVFVTSDASPLEFLIPAVFALASASHGFYYWKAKAENLQKWGQEDKIEALDDEEAEG